MGRLLIEQRSDGSVLLTDRGPAPRGVGVCGLAVGALLLIAAVTGEATLVGSVVLLPLGLIVLLAGLAALRHRDWILLDRAARQVSYRRGLASIFRAVRTFAFGDVEAIVVDRTESDATVLLRMGPDSLWPVDRSTDAAYVTRLVAAIHGAAGWPVRSGRLQAHRSER